MMYVFQTGYPVGERVVCQQATIIAFLAEHDLPFRLAPDLIALTKSLARDHTALQQLSLDRTTASYKLCYGLGQSIEDLMTARMVQHPFSLNVDESTSKHTHERVSFKFEKAALLC